MRLARPVAAAFARFFCVLGILVAIALQVPAVAAQGKRPQRANGASLPHLDDIVKSAVAADEIPGAVLLVSHDGIVVHRRAYGSRAILP